MSSIKKRANVAEMYNKKLAAIDEVAIPFIASETTKMSWFVYVVQLDKRVDRDRIIKFLFQEGIQCKPYFTSIHLQPFYKDIFGFKKGDFPVTEDVSSRTIALPFFNSIKEEQLEYVVEKLKEGIVLNR